MRTNSFRIMAVLPLVLAAASGAAAQNGAREDKRSPKPAPSRPLPPEITGSKLYSFSAWTKVCGREGGNPSAPRICLTMLEVKRQAGSFAAGAALIEGAGERTILRITLPAEVNREAGARIAVDSDKGLHASFVGCLPRGCIADFEATAPLIAKLRDGETLHLRGTGEKGQPVSYRLPLSGFAEANDGQGS